MKIFLSILFLPCYIVGFFVGILIRPIFVGYLNGYFYLELKEYKDLLPEEYNVDNDLQTDD